MAYNLFFEFYIENIDRDAHLVLGAGSARLSTLYADAVVFSGSSLSSCFMYIQGNVWEYKVDCRVKLFECILSLYLMDVYRIFNVCPLMNQVLLRRTIGVTARGLKIMS